MYIIYTDFKIFISEYISDYIPFTFIPIAILITQNADVY
jgi:hypothetical protein